jgi:hypothetical protein
MAKEQLTKEKVMQLLNASLKAQVERSYLSLNNDEILFSETAIENGILKAYLSILVDENPARIADVLHLARKEFEVIKYDNEHDLIGEILYLGFDETTAEFTLKHAQLMEKRKFYNPSLIKMTCKIVEL